MDPKEIKDFLLSMDSPNKVNELLSKLNFDNYSEPQELNPAKLDLRKNERENVQSIYTLNDYSNTLITFLVEVSEINNTLINSLPEFFEMRLPHPFIILTDDYINYYFILISKERKGRGEFENKIIKMEINREDPKRTPIEILSNMHLNQEQDNPYEIYKILENALDVEAVTKSFYNNYKNIFNEMKEYFCEQQPNLENAKEKAHRFSHQFLNRLMFIHFIQKKGWLGNNEDFISWFWDEYRRLEGLNDTFYQKWLFVLFFEAFNNKFQPKDYLPQEINKILDKAPFLNGGLFTENDLDHIGYEIDDEKFRRIFDFFDKYNFTIKEDTPLEIDVAVDPEMIGKVYESLVNVSEESGKRSEAGIFYTDRVEIDLMCKRSLVEYFNNHLDISKELIYDMLFAVGKKEKRNIDKELANKNYWDNIRELIKELKAVDPACGSGSFLIGLLEILFDLYKRSFNYSEEKLTASNFDIKKNIIGRSLFGVDIMQWAIDVAELRLWLQLIIETDIEEHEVREKPLLPNLSFNLRQGDSLIQEIGGRDFSFGALKNIKLFGSVERDLKELAKEKYKFYRGEESSKFENESEIKEAEKRFYKKLIQKEIDKTEKKIKKYKSQQKNVQAAFDFADKDEQLKFESMSNNEVEEKIEEFKNKLDELNDVKDKIDNLEDDYFVWEIDFPEVFLGEKEGFDIVIGNPPYVRQENIKPPLPSSPENYKDKLVNNIKDKHKIKLNKKSDLYVYFYIQGLSILNEKGTLCFISSNSWLDVKFGYKLQNFLLDNVEMKAIYDNSKKRSFEQADVNTIISIFGSIENSQQHIRENTVKFVVFRKAFGKIIDKNLMKRIHNSDTKRMKEDYRVYPISQAKLKDKGIDYSNSKNLKDKDVIDRINSLDKYNYKGDKWGGKYLLSPDFYLDLLLNNKLVPLEKVADYNYGKKLGAVDFFYLNDSDLDKYFTSKEKSLYASKILNSSRHVNRVLLENEDLNNFLHIEKKTLNEHGLSKRLKEYIEWGEDQNFHKRSSLKNKDKWFAVKNLNSTKIILPQFYDKRFFTFYSREKIYCTNSFWNVRPKNQIPEKLLCSVMNSTLHFLSLELFGRRNLGEGVLTVYGPDFDKIHILDINTLSQDSRSKIMNSFDSLLSRPINDIFEECGLNPDLPIENQEPDPLSDRSNIDNVIFDELGLNKEDRKKVYRSLCRLVKNRIEKAISV